METSPAAMSGMNIGTKNGDTRSGPLSDVGPAVVLEGLHPADAAADDDAGALGRRELPLQPRLRDGLMGGREGELGEEVVPPGFLPVDVLQRIEPLDLAGEPDRQLRRGRTW